MDSGRDEDSGYSMCGHWAERLRRFDEGYLDSGIVGKHKCGRCDMCCDEGDMLDHARRDGE